MPIPGQTFNILEQGLGLTEPAATIPLFYGHSSTGAVHEIGTVSSVSALVAGWGQGPMVEAAAFTLQNGGGPVRVMRADTSVAGSNSSVTASGGGPTVSLAGTPNDAYIGQIRIRSAGALGVATFDYTLDNGETWSEIQTVPSGGSYAIPNTGITVTFDSGSYVLGETYSWTSTPPMWNSTDLAGAFNVLAASSLWWDFFVGCGAHADATAGAGIAAALQTHLNSLAASHRHKAGMIDAGIDSTSDVISSYASVVANRVLVAYGWARLQSAKPFPGWSRPRLRLVDAVARQAAVALISTDLGRVASGVIPGCDSVEHDEYLNEELDAHRITTARSYPGEPGVSGLDGYFLTTGRIKSQAGSDFQLWQYRRMMDVACALVYAKQAQMINEGFRTKADGTISDEDAESWREEILDALNERFLRVKAANGTFGHVSAVDYQIDRTNNIISSQTVQTALAIQPRGYAKFINTTLSFVASLSAAA